MKLSRNIVVAVFVVTSLVGSALGQGLGANTVLCITPAGHAAIEPGQNGVCASRLGEPEGVPCFDEMSSGSGCGPCFDMPAFQNHPYLNASSEGSPIPGVIPLLSSEQGKVSGSSLRSTPPLQRTDFTSPALTSIRTTILLI